MAFDVDQEEGLGLNVAPPTGPLKGEYKLCPFSYWDTRDAEWRRRRRIWLNRGIRSEEGRADGLTYSIPKTMSDGRKGNKIEAQTSVFDPVVCELAYRWWCKPGGIVMDPFAGGSVRGIVASLMERRYYGIELRAEQVEANRAQLNPSTTGTYPPKWKQGDAMVALTKDAPYDFLFSCPPYGNLEVYSDDPADISNMEYKYFLDRYRLIIAMAVSKLRNNRFACFVVANYRAKEPGRQMVNLVGDTVQAFEEAGAAFYNDIVLLNGVGSGAMRSNTIFLRGARKMVKLHQNILVFVKGNPKLAALEIPVGKESEEKT